MAALRSRTRRFGVLESCFGMRRGGTLKVREWTTDKEVGMNGSPVALDDPEGLRASDELIDEQSYLVARGVRALALVGRCRADSVLMLRAATRLEALADTRVVPFVLDRGDGVAECGFAAASWVLDLYRWLALANPATLPPQHRERVIGLLLGYSVDAIR